MFLSIVLVNAYITANIAYICTSLYSLSLCFCLWMCIPVSEDIIHSWCICTSLNLCLSLFLWLFIFVFGYIVTDCTYIGASLIPRFCLSLFLLSFSVSGYIIDNVHVFEQARSGRSMCNRALENVCIIINSACIRTSNDSYFFLSLWLWMSVPVSGYVMTHCMCIYVSWSCLFFSVSLNICSSVRLYCQSL